MARTVRPFAIASVGITISDTAARMAEAITPNLFEAKGEEAGAGAAAKPGQPDSRQAKHLWEGHADSRRVEAGITLGSVDLHEHWEGIYTSRAPDVVSWYEPVPRVSRKLVVEACQEGAESVIDVGGGASSLVDELLELGVKRVAVLDISEAGLAVSKRRLGRRADQVEWIVGDVTTVVDIGPFDVWHDRAVFHFLTANEDRRRYVQLAEHTLPSGGTAVMATFASDGPARCSGLEVRRYDPGQLAEQCGPGFELIQSEPYVHTTPSGSHQSFLFATFHRIVENR
jgi:SAM-dependent methyltransferase